MESSDHHSQKDAFEAGMVVSMTENPTGYVVIFSLRSERQYGTCRLNREYFNRWKYRFMSDYRRIAGELMSHNIEPIYIETDKGVTLWANENRHIPSVKRA